MGISDEVDTPVVDQDIKVHPPEDEEMVVIPVMKIVDRNISDNNRGTYVYNDTGNRRVPIASPLLWLRVKGKQDGPALRALIDTGSSLNLISSACLQKVNKVFMTNHDVEIMGVTGKSKCGKWYYVTLEFPNGHISTMAMLESPHEGIGIILGMPFLEQHNGEIRC